MFYAVVVAVLCWVLLVWLTDGCLLPWLLLIPHSLAALLAWVFRIWMGWDGMGWEVWVEITCLGWRRRGRFLVQKIVVLIISREGGGRGGLLYTAEREGRQTDRWLAL